MRISGTELIVKFPISFLFWNTNCRNKHGYFNRFAFYEKVLFFLQVWCVTSWEKKMATTCHTKWNRFWFHSCGNISTSVQHRHKFPRKNNKRTKENSLDLCIIPRNVFMYCKLFLKKTTVYVACYPSVSEFGEWAIPLKQASTTMKRGKKRNGNVSQVTLKFLLTLNAVHSPRRVWQINKQNNDYCNIKNKNNVFFSLISLATSFFFNKIIVANMIKKKWLILFLSFAPTFPSVPQANW